MSIISGKTGTDPLERLRARPGATKGPECPNEDRVRMLAVGLTEPGEATQLLEHAASCDWCGAILREAAQDLGEPPTAHEMVLARSSWVADRARRRALAQRLAGPGPLQFPGRGWWLIPRVIVPVVALVLGIVLWPRNNTTEAHRLLCRAYTAKRTIEIRLAGAEFGPLRVERGVGSSHFDRPPELLEAEALIGRGIAEHPDDPKWVQLQGRADLLDGKENAAIAELDRAHALSPHDTDVLSDLGAAYYEKAEKTGDLKTYAQAFDYLSKGVQLKPANLTLIFNRALAAEKIFAFNEAKDGWETYLRVDSPSGWANVAREHLKQIKKNSAASWPTPQPRPPMR